jgi:hypothetical protein
MASYYLIRSRGRDASPVPRPEAVAGKKSWAPELDAAYIADGGCARALRATVRSARAGGLLDEKPLALHAEVRPIRVACASLSRPIRRRARSTLSCTTARSPWSMPSVRPRVWPSGNRLTVHPTPKHASWLNQVEIELSLLSRPASAPAAFPICMSCSEKSGRGQLARPGGPASSGISPDATRDAS